MVTGNDVVFDPFGLDEHEEEKATLLPFDPFTSTVVTTAAPQPNDERQYSRAALERPTATRRLSPAPPTVQRVSRSNSAKALPPKITVKLVIREDATAMATSGGSSNVEIIGTVQAQIQCSDATKNAPFRLQVDALDTWNVNDEFVNDETLQVYIPKHEIGLVHLMDFAVHQHIQRMPLLLERKISVKENTCRISIQVRSKLANKGDLKDLSIAIAVPIEVDGESICILRGDDGIYDELRRIVHWRLDELKRGESLMVAAEAQLWERPSKDKALDFPVVLRASSNEDQISAVDCQAIPAEGHPSSVAFTRSHSFRLLYRLQ